VSYIKHVERWVEEGQAKLKLAKPDTPYYRQLEESLRQNEKLLAHLKEITAPKQRELLPREPGEDG
jgi:hypothetical protein